MNRTFFLLESGLQKGRLLNLFQQDGDKKNTFCIAQMRNILVKVRLYYLLIPLMRKAENGKISLGKTQWIQVGIILEAFPPKSMQI